MNTNFEKLIQEYDEAINQSDASINLDICRQAIDHIDLALIELLHKRMDIVNKVGIYKSQHFEGRNYSRPRREATMLRQLIHDNHNVYPNEAIIAIWRNIISASLHHEQPISVASLSTANDQTINWLAREYFGNFVRHETHEDSPTILQKIDDRSIGFGVFPLSSDNNWWQIVGQQFPDLYVITHLPIATNQATLPTGLVIAKILPEEAGSDISLYYIQSDQLPDELVNGLGDDASIVCSDHNHYLVAIPGFHLELNQDITKEFMQVKFLGTYATVMDE